MLNNNSVRIASLAALALAGRLWAGGFYLQAVRPTTSEAQLAHAVLTIKAAGCHDPATAKVVATAIGMVNGQRREIPLKLVPLSEPGSFALSQQWPTEGRWVIQLVGHNDGALTTSVLRAGPDGIDLKSWKGEMREFKAAEIEAMLRD